LAISSLTRGPNRRIKSQPTRSVSALTTTKTGFFIVPSFLHFESLQKFLHSDFKKFAGLCQPLKGGLKNSGE
jgi:hypothetical protein